jgi:hypothetical protein
MTIAESMAMRRAGFTIREIAERAGVGYATMQSRLYRWGIKAEFNPVRMRLTGSLAEEMHTLYWERGLSISDLADYYRISPGRVADRMRRLGIGRRERADAIRLAMAKGKGNRLPLPAGCDPVQAGIASGAARRARRDAAR